MRAGLALAVPAFFSFGVSNAQWPGSTCTEHHVKYDPPNDFGHKRSIEKNWASCQARCKALQDEGCAHFSFWPDGACDLSSDRAARIWVSSDGMVSGDASCEAAPGFPVVVLPPPPPAPLPTTPPDFSLPTAPAAVPTAPAARDEGPPDLCPGSIELKGHGRVSVIPTGWKGGLKGARIGAVRIEDKNLLVPHMDGRAYFADRCTGAYNHTDYVGLNLLNQRLTFHVLLKGAGCGCNAAFYLVSMKQNARESKCFDYYCDANDVCGVSCDEVDIMEANQHAFHSTLHTLYDHAGKGVGYGGGDSWNGPRDFTSKQYGPGAECIDTNKPFMVSCEFPTDWQGNLKSMDVKLSQTGSTCDVSMSVTGYQGNSQLTMALKHGMTPVFSYWNSKDMLWMDGVGADHQGPCTKDRPEMCSDTVSMYDFAIESIGGGEAAPAPAPAPSAWQDSWSTPADERAPAPSTTIETVTTTRPPCSITRKADCSLSQCCHDPGMQCYQKDAYWSACQLDCTPGIDPRDPPGHRTPWTCKLLGERSLGDPIPTTTTPPTTTQRMEPGNSRCASVTENCAESKCCFDPGLQCYQKHAWWSSCLVGCESTKADPWTCTALGARTDGDPLTQTSTTSRPAPAPPANRSEFQSYSAGDSGFWTNMDPDAPACSRTRKEDCRFTRCCQDPGMQCYEKDEYWAACEVDCEPGIDPRDPSGMRSSWTCKQLGRRTPGDPIPTTTTTKEQRLSLGAALPVPDPQPGECAREHQNCRDVGCCVDKFHQCFERDAESAFCLPGCDPGVDVGQGGRWTCRLVGPERSASAARPAFAAPPASAARPVSTAAPAHIPASAFSNPYWPDELTGERYAVMEPQAVAASTRASAPARLASIVERPVLALGVVAATASLVAIVVQHLRQRRHGAWTVYHRTASTVELLAGEVDFAQCQDA